MRRGRARLLGFALAVFFALAGIALGYNLTLSGSRRHAKSSIALIAKMVPRVSGYRLEHCRRLHGSRFRCTFRLTVRALSGGTITCHARIQVRMVTTTIHRGHRRLRRQIPLSTYPGRPTCVRNPRGG